MHFSNYISRRDVADAIATGVRFIRITPTVLKQTPKETLDFLKANGVEVEIRAERGRPRRLSEKEVERVLAIRRSNLSFQKIASLTGVAKSTVFDYYKRNGHAEMSDEHVRTVQLQEAKAFLSALLEKNLNEEINELARGVLESGDLEEIERAVRKIEDIVQHSTL